MSDYQARDDTPPVPVWAVVESSRSVTRLVAVKTVTRGVLVWSYYIIHFYIIQYILYISYRVTGLYRLGKTCYLHSLLCNNSIICIVYCAIIVLLHSLLCKMILFQFAHGKMITQPTLTPPQTRDW